ncbi:hypothetical protein DAETH_44460 (plasmid) [Deinococcus aetherius]|uniref:DDE domain-containing protein n=1 Tax=Deinococcus aetherius TaxID=200252 RepID=A0ABN6RMD5_9DEIO|nr:hypothetical protein DAETH_44460 [Deinococcus aetherius]
MTDRKPYRHRFPRNVIGDALRLDHRFPLSQRDVQELLHERGVQVSHETLRQWNIPFAPLLTEELRHRESQRGSRWPLDEVCVKVGGVGHGLWRAVNEHTDVLDILLQEHRDTEAAKSARCNNLVEQSHRRARQQERSQLGFEHRNSSRCTPESRTFTARPERPSPLPSDEATRPQHCSSGARRFSRRLDSQAAC